MGRSLWIIARTNETACGVAQQRQRNRAQVQETQVRGLPPVSKPQHFLSIEFLDGPLSMDYRKRETANGCKSRTIGQPVDFHLAFCPSFISSGRKLLVI
jgi:hypothetical protein